MNDYRKKAFVELSQSFPSLAAMARHFGVSAPAMSKWKKFGVPLARVPYLMLRYPKLKAWEGLPKRV